MSCSWSTEQRKSFFGRMAEFWKGSLVNSFNESTAPKYLIELWLDKVGTYPVAVALQALRLIKEDEEVNRAPTMTRVAAKCFELIEREREGKSKTEKAKDDPNAITFGEFCRRTGRKSKLLESILPPEPTKPAPKTEPAPDFIEEITVPDRPSYDPDEVPF